MHGKVRGGVVAVALGGAVLLGLGVVYLVRRARRGRPRLVVALGDSLTADGRYARALEAVLPLGSVVRVFGYVGKGVRDVAAHLDEALALGPTDVVVLAGVNDIASGRSVETVVNGLASMYGRIAAAGARPVAVLLTPWRGDAAKTAAVNDWITRSGVAHVDTAVLGDGSGRLARAFNSGDGLHLNAAGQAALGQLIFEQAFA